MEKLRCLVIDPDRNARELLRRHIEKVPHLQWVAALASPLEAMRYLQLQAVDVLFMDFELPELNGQEFLQLLNPKPLVIFTTAHQKYALQGFQLDAIDFLLKPIDFQNFIKSINKATRLFYLLRAALPALPKPAEGHHIILKANRKFYRIPLEEILYIQGMKEYAAIYLQNNNRLLFLHSLRHLEEMLPSGHFMRIHKSYIIAIAKTTALEGNILYLGSVKVPIGESYKNRVVEVIFS